MPRGTNNISTDIKNGFQPGQVVGSTIGSTVGNAVGTVVGGPVGFFVGGSIINRSRHLRSFFAEQSVKNGDSS